MDSPPKPTSSHERGAALIIVLAFVVLLTGLVLAYLSRTTSDRQVAHSSFNQSKVDQFAASAMDNIIGDLRQEITNGSTATSVNGVTIYTPTIAANMIPQRSGNPAGVPNLIRRSVRSDPISAPGVGSRASAVNSTTNVSANGRSITSTRWNSHYLVPKKDTTTSDSLPIDAFTSATPDWVFVTNQGATVISSPNNSVIGRYAYAIYDEGGLLDMNVAGYPTNTAQIQSGRKGSLAFADLRALGAYPIPNPDGSGLYQIDRLVGWRNYATTIQSATSNNNFPDTAPASKAFARNFQASSTPAGNYYSYVASNGNGFLGPSPTVAPNGRTDQAFLSRQELIAFQKTLNTNNGNPIANTSQFDLNALQYLSSFSREANSPSFSPSTPVGSTIDYAALASTSTAVNPNFLLRRVTTSFTRFDGTSAVVGEPLVKTRFPLSRLAWITYKGPSFLRTLPPQSPTLPNTDSNYDMWALQWIYGIPASYLQAGTAANIKTCFGLTFPTGGTAGDEWTYTNPTGAGAASQIMRLDQIAALNPGREPDFFELLQAAILSGSLGQYTNTGGAAGGVTGGNVFPDIHMSSTMHHILTIGASIIDQADVDSIPTRIQFNANGHIWTAYGVENLPYITQVYPIAGTSPNDSTKWATYLLFQLWNPHQSPVAVSNNVRLRIDGGIGIFAGGNGQAWDPANTVNVYPPAGQVTFVTLKSGSFSIPTPLATDNASTTSTAQGTFAFLPAPPAVPAPTP
jgi:Tfp pilus assembly protein PilX